MTHDFSTCITKCVGNATRCLTVWGAAITWATFLLLYTNVLDKLTNVTL